MEHDDLVGGIVQDAEVLADNQPEDVWREGDFGDSDTASVYDDAQQQWEESVEQLRQLATLVLLPLAGKFMGRRFAYHEYAVWAKYVAYQNSL